MEDKTDKQNEFIELRAKGNSFDRIANRLKVSKGTLIGWSKEYQQEVSNFSAMERETLAEQYRTTRNHQLALFGEQLQKVRLEIQKRDLGDVTTDKLVNMEIKLLDAINTLGVGVVLAGDEDMFKLAKEQKWEA